MGDDREEDQTMAADLITLKEAAHLAGYSGDDAANLRRAARQGRLKTKQLGGWQRFTTRAWLDEYLAGLSHPTRGGRGRRRKEQEPEQ
jgi:hypothetical protein